MKTHRDNGAIGALLDEYQKAIEELKHVISTIDDQTLAKIVDHKTKDEDCRSIQTILTHVIRAGYIYVIDIRKSLGEQIEYYHPKHESSAANYKIELDKMFSYNDQFFKDYPNVKIEEYDNELKIKVKWGQTYDIEQLFEHAIVHILRHRRQIERFLIKLNG